MAELIETEKIVSKIRSGDRASLSKALTEVEYLSPIGRELMEEFGSVEPRIIGWTGGGGAGKSTLLSAVLGERKKSNAKIAVLAIDPTSPFSGGSVLGDRIRMDEHTLAESIYIRSLPTRNKQSSIAPGTVRMARFLAGVGFTEIHVETVGVGQTEVEIASIAETSIVIVSPNTGDTIQAVKAGLLEIADIYVVTKGDLDGASAAALHLEAAVKAEHAGWKAPVMMTSAKNREGIVELSKKIDEHFTLIEKSGERSSLNSRRRESEWMAILTSRLMDDTLKMTGFSDLLEQVKSGEIGPSVAAEKLLGS